MVGDPFGHGGEHLWVVERRKGRRHQPTASEVRPVMPVVDGDSEVTKLVVAARRLAVAPVDCGSRGGGGHGHSSHPSAARAE